MRREWEQRRWSVSPDGEVTQVPSNRADSSGPEESPLGGDLEPGPDLQVTSDDEVAADPSQVASGTTHAGQGLIEGTEWAKSERPRPRRSRENALKHGAYANRIPFIAYGPLKEDPEEVLSFYKSVEMELQPGDSAILQAQCREIAGLQWRLIRLRKWEADAYSLPEAQSWEYEPDRSAYFAGERELACEVLGRLGDPELSVDELRRALVALAQVTEDAGPIYVGLLERFRSRDQVLSALISFVAEFYKGDVEEAERRLSARAEVLRQREWERRYWDSLVGARVEMSSDFTRSLLDAIARTSRELDRAIARYRLTKQMLMRLME